LFLWLRNRPIPHAPKAKPVIKAHKTALIAYRVPPNTRDNCRIQISSYIRLAAPEIKMQKKGISLEGVLRKAFILYLKTEI
jgi:hypothetical protein